MGCAQKVLFIHFYVPPLPSQDGVSAVVYTFVLLWGVLDWELLGISRRELPSLLILSRLYCDRLVRAVISKYLWLEVAMYQVAPRTSSPTPRLGHTFLVLFLCLPPSQALGSDFAFRSVMYYQICCLPHQTAEKVRSCPMLRVASTLINMLLIMIGIANSHSTGGGEILHF